MPKRSRDDDTCPDREEEGQGEGFRSFWPFSIHGYARRRHKRLMTRVTASPPSTTNTPSESKAATKEATPEPQLEPEPKPPKDKSPPSKAKTTTTATATAMAEVGTPDKAPSARSASASEDVWTRVRALEYQVATLQARHTLLVAESARREAVYKHARARLRAILDSM